MEETKKCSMARKMDDLNTNILNDFCREQKQKNNIEITLKNDGFDCVTSRYVSRKNFFLEQYPCKIDIHKISENNLKSMWIFSSSLESCNGDTTGLLDMALDFLFFLHNKRRMGELDKVITETLCLGEVEKKDGRFLYKLEYAISGGVW